MKKTGAILSVLVILFLAGSAYRADAASLLIPVAEFTYDGWGGADPMPYFKSFHGGYLAGSDAGPCLVASVRLPGNATKINKVIVYLIDNGTGAYDPYFTLDAIDMTTGTTYNYFAYEVTTGTSTVQAIELPLSQKQLVKGRVYQLGTCLSGGQYLYGAKVVYTVP